MPPLLQVASYYYTFFTYYSLLSCYYMLARLALDISISIVFISSGEKSPVLLRAIICLAMSMNSSLCDGPATASFGVYTLAAFGAIGTASRGVKVEETFLFFRLKLTDLNLLKRIALECFAQARQRDPARRGAKPGSDPCHSDHMKIIRTFSYLESRSDYLFYSNMELKKLITLIHVAEFGSLTRAAVSYSKKIPSPSEEGGGITAIN